MSVTNKVKLTIKKNDQVQVIAGREKGKTGRVLRVNSKTGRITVEKLNMVKRHARPTQQNPQGGLVEKESPIHYSNVLLYCTKCSKGVRHGFKAVEQSGAKKGASKAKTTVSKQVKIRVCKRCNEPLATA